VYSHPKYENKFEICFYDAVNMFVKCFYKVSVECIKHCWKHTGIYTDSIDDNKVDADEEEIKNNDHSNRDNNIKLTNNYNRKYSNKEGSSNKCDENNNDKISKPTANLVSSTEDENCDIQTNLEIGDFQKIPSQVLTEMENKRNDIEISEKVLNTRLRQLYVQKKETPGDGV
jgi:hypothetical protein